MGACSVCAHSECGAINTSLARGVSYRTLARRHALSLSALSRHRNRHIPEALRDKAAAIALVGRDVSLAV